MRLKIGLLLRSLLVVGSFLGLVVLWSSLSPRPDEPSPLSRMREDRAVNNPVPDRGGNGLALGDDRFKPVVPWPHVEGVEVDLESIRRRNKARHEQEHRPGGENQKDIMQRQYLTFKPQTFTYRDPVLRPGVLGNFEPKEPEPPGVVGGPGEKAKPLVLGPEFKHAVQASIKEFGFNMVASDMISLDRSVNDLRQEESPAMAGGLFAIERDFFFELGLYDPGLQIWGGENFEISYKIWQCGGKLLFVPCSRVGHIYRLEGWQGNPPPVYVGSSPTLKNYVRVVEVWWDEYKDYFYASRPESKALAYGDISELKKFREDHNCKSFKWFMEEIAYDITSHYPLPPKNVDWGEIRGFETAYCIDSMGKTNGGFVELGPCHRMGGNQLFRINEANQLMQYDQCLTKGPDGSKVMITHCNLNEFKEWQYFKNLHRLTHIPSGKCLDRSEVLHQVFISDCDSGKMTQKWEINNIHSV
ncbi:N-acetylgalactosaminyltransferase 7 isoform X4 [Odocoileus virginianus]|uniref:N-acetylgalactosaminyltransferase 7 isoform X4 n=1 Tax=Odocoileus virginianus TaxID=9874 RepID=A0ABM4J9N5_ODOVR